MENKNKEIQYWGTLLLNGGINFDFYEEFEDEEVIGITDSRSNYYAIPTKNILDFHCKTSRWYN